MSRTSFLVPSTCEEIIGMPDADGGPDTDPGDTCRIERARLPGLRSTLIGALPLLVCALTFWFHGIMDTGLVFTHLFYIPIILSAVWWGRRGLVVALFLAAILLGSNLSCARTSSPPTTPCGPPSSF